MPGPFRMAFAPIAFFPNIDQNRFPAFDLFSSVIRRDLRDVLLCLRDQFLKAIWLCHARASDWPCQHARHRRSPRLSASQYRLTSMKFRVTLCSLSSVVSAGSPPSAQAEELGWQPEKTWVFVVGVCIGSIATCSVLSRSRIAGTPPWSISSSKAESRTTQVVYLQDKQATQKQIDSAFAAQLKKLRSDDLLIVYYCGHGSKSDDGERCFPRLLRCRRR